MPQTRRIIPLLPLATAVEPAVRIHARAVHGRFATLRRVLAGLTQLVFCGLPWLNWQGRQALLFDLEARRFHLFGAVMVPQDLIHLTGLLVFGALLLFFATALYGRVWCGFACPQTVYTSLFMGIEQRFEGDRLARQRLDAAPWGVHKLLRRGGKHLAWLALALFTGFSLVGWFSPVRELAAALPVLALGPWEAFWLLFYGGATYVHAGWLREKVCLHACPYGRFQGAMLDAGSRVVSYDLPRGEPRGARARGSDARARGQGDCVNCTLCVQVCPVGIDIRQGLQAACISCGLCIDACDAVMDKMQAPRGLIRFAPLQAQAAGRPARRLRVWAYGTALLLLAGAMAWGWAARPELRLNVVRDRAVLSRLGPDGMPENVYRLRVMNASQQPRRLAVSAWVEGVERATPLALAAQTVLALGPAGEAMAVVALRLPPSSTVAPGQGRRLPIRIAVVDQGGAGSARAEAASTFFLP